MIMASFGLVIFFRALQITIASSEEPESQILFVWDGCVVLGTVEDMVGRTGTGMDIISGMGTFAGAGSRMGAGTGIEGGLLGDDGVQF